MWDTVARVDQTCRKSEHRDAHAGKLRGDSGRHDRVLRRQLHGRRGAEPEAQYYKMYQDDFEGVPLGIMRLVTEKITGTHVSVEVHMRDTCETTPVDDESRQMK